MLEIKNINNYYADLHVLRDVSLEIKKGEIVALFGPNGHGKSTLLKTICGLHPAATGSVVFEEEDITKTPSHKIVEMGIAYIPEERNLFGDMSVYENLILGAYNTRAHKDILENLAFIYQIFPRLVERRTQRCSTLSGGESRMVAVARGLMSEPSLLLVDEPSIGLSPSMRSVVFNSLEKINKEKKITILIVEQEIGEALKLSDRIYMIKKGQIIFERLAADVDVREIEKAYF
jgi:branched-chain amino acid transport system ATP-binding protein